ncbi:uroporphyrinogen decarboxylase [Sulfurospirillum multivorans]|uniref:Uroporphyrinogen decarboxylase n=2 Tax=Sulfurospirillum multivorans TaxID=66821 RepID=A0AA86DYS0_SULMK|nr:uroporphyrinogen decarboxylase [Sulfurospirillum multivorans]AHJ11685.1 uroporphyrinogen III decarboxylase [Sulfurospirillum multivorans DSM 12446]QEH05185.1 uroporphyrinogen III decarboxylase [Sulfurospirillum multivorans]
MIFVDACFGKKTPYTPVWMMRQAGRYLPEYMKVRAQAGDFLRLCKDPEKACEVTLQPVDILGVDAAILFSDILVVPLEMGMELQFLKGEGPVFSHPITNQADLDKLSVEKAIDGLAYVYETIKLIRGKLAADKALIGFCGAPWTLATYMIEGQGTKTYALVKKMIYSNPQFMHALLKKVTEVLKGYMERQIQSGANVVMIFDSWAAALEESAYFEFSWSYMKEISAYLKSKYPHVPVILFPKGISGYLDRIDGEFDVFGVDWSTPIELAKAKLGGKYVLQGNMEPTRLYSKEAIDEGIEHIVTVMKNERHIFNLGHGILPDIPVEHAKYFIKQVQTRTKI